MKNIFIIFIFIVVPLPACGDSGSTTIEGAITGFWSAYNDGDYAKCLNYCSGYEDDEEIGNEIYRLAGFFKFCEAAAKSVSKNSSSSKSFADTLKDTENASSIRLSDARSLVTFGSIHWVISVINPVTSASGMNAAGARTEPSGCFQRIRLSAPQILPVSNETIG